MYRKRFSLREFGKEIDHLLLPDVFGYSANLPQILIKSGCRIFMTQKLSWNQFTTFPYNSFFWEGVDGSKVLAHFPPENSYNSELSPEGRDD